MSKYGDTENKNSVNNTDVTNIQKILRGKTALNLSFTDELIDETIDQARVVSDSVNDFFKLNVNKDYAFSGPSAKELLKVNHVANGNLPVEEYNDADYDWSVSSKGANVDMNNDAFVASFPTTIDYRSWDGETDIPKECGWAKVYTKNGEYNQYANIVPSSEFLKKQDFTHTDFGLKSTAISENFIAVSSYLYGGNDANPRTGYVNIYQKFPNGKFLFRHLIEIENITRAPTVEILDDFLFVGNPSNVSVFIYKLSDLEKNQMLKGPSFIKPIQVLTELQISNIDQPSAHHPSMFGFSIKAYSNGVDKFLLIGSPHYTKFMEDEPYNGDVEIGAVYVYKYNDGTSSWEYKQQILPKNWENIPVEDGYGFEKLAIKFGYAFDFIFRPHGSMGSKGILLIGAPKYYKQVPPLRREGRVYCYRLDNNDLFSWEDVISFPEFATNIGQDDIGLFEFGRSISLDNQDNAWIASEPPQGTTILRYGVSSLDFDAQTWDYEENYLITNERGGGVLSTNREDVVCGTANNIIKVFQSEGSVKILKSNDSQHSEQEETLFLVEKLNKDFPSEWGKPPLTDSENLCVLPFGFGVGSPKLAEWITDNSTGDARLNNYVKNQIESESDLSSQNYEELVKTGNPTIKIYPWTSTIGNVINVYCPHGHLLAEYGNPLLYKGSTKFVMRLNANTPNNKMASWKVNDTFIDGPDQIELNITGENITVSVDFKRNVNAFKNVIKIVESKNGKIIISEKEG